MSASEQESLQAARQTVKRLHAELEEETRAANDFVNQLLQDAPRCWDGDESAESLALGYLRALEAATAAGNIATETTRHRETCDGQC